MKGAFFLELTESARQKADMRLAHVLNRIRIGAAAEEDAAHLSERHLELDHMPKSDQSRWRAAAALTARSAAVNALNRIGMARSGSIFGALNAHAMPSLSRRRGRENKLKRARAFFSSNDLDFMPPHGQGSDFKPPKMLPARYGVPIMLRSNICPEIGLHNGAMGQAVGLLSNNNDKNLAPHEKKDSLVERAVAGAGANPAHIPHLLAEMPSYMGAMNAFGEMLIDAGSDEAKSRRAIVIIEPKLFKDRYALPVVAAHALTMRKSQSLALPWVIIDPKGAFSPGALCVAFSRVPQHERFTLQHPVSKEMLSKFHKALGKIGEKLKDIERDSCNLEPFEKYISEKEKAHIADNLV